VAEPTKDDRRRERDAYKAAGKEERAQRREDYRAARDALDRKQERDEAAGQHEETGEYLRLNDDVAQAEIRVPWYRR
jgi:hypothetical protein